MGRLKKVPELIEHQLKNLWRLIYGIPVCTPSLGSMTLDLDDVQLADDWLEQPDRWFDAAIVEEYETSFRNWNGSRYAYAFMGGREALTASIDALQLQPGDEVLLPGYTCVVVPNAFDFAGIRVRFCDIELETYGLDAEDAEKRITENTRVILIQHLYGLVCRDYEKLLRLAKKHHLRVIEDCAQSTGAEFQNVKIGNRGDVAIYSSEQSKVWNTVQGGMAITNNEDIAQRLRAYSEELPYPDDLRIIRQLHTLIMNYYTFKHPQRWWREDWVKLHYGHARLVSTTTEEKKGRKPACYGRRMPAPIAAIGLNQISKIDDYNARRRQQAAEWDRWCEINNYIKPMVLPESIPVYLRYPVLVEPERKKNTSWAVKHLGVRPGMWFATHVHPSKRKVSGCPNADKAVECCINFPLCYGVNNG